MKRRNLTQIHVTISVMKITKWAEFTELTTIANVKRSKSLRFLNFDINTVELNKVNEF